MLSLTTDYFTDTGCAAPYLRRIADAGFQRVHWCHEWDSDHVYSDDEIRQIGRWLDDCGLKMLDLHASAGKQMAWAADSEASRRAGVELVRNRIEMAARLDCDVIIMHLSAAPAAGAITAAPLRRSLDELEPFARKRGVRIAIENLRNDTFEACRALFALYGSDYLGFCYDSGHGNIGGQGLDHLDTVKDRLISVHLHDNDGSDDRHDIIFNGTVDWPRLARILTRSAYTKCVSSESNLRKSEIRDERLWLQKAHAACAAFARMLETRRSAFQDSSEAGALLP
jgi:sugar phosphate isomerase/epimerase